MRTCTRCGIYFDFIAGEWCADCVDVEGVETGWENGEPQDECLRGHEWTDANTAYNQGKRYCTICRSDRRKALRKGEQLPRPETAEKYPDRAQSVKDLWLNGLTDKEIAARLGIAYTTAFKWRNKRLGLPVNSRGGISRDPEKAQRQIDALAKYHRSPEGRALSSRTGKQNKARGNSAWNPTPGTQGTFVASMK